MVIIIKFSDHMVSLLLLVPPESFNWQQFNEYCLNPYYVPNIIPRPWKSNDKLDMHSLTLR